MRKEIIKVFKELWLRIMIDINLRKLNFLDVSFNMETGTYKQCRKFNDSPLYIYANSSNPPNIVKQLLRNIGKRTSNISTNKEIFDQAAPYYHKNVKAGGYKEKIEYSSTTGVDNRTPSRKRNNIWLNPFTV